MKPFKRNFYVQLTSRCSCIFSPGFRRTISQQRPCLVRPVLHFHSYHCSECLPRSTRGGTLLESGPLPTQPPSLDTPQRAAGCKLFINETCRKKWQIFIFAQIAVHGLHTKQASCFSESVRILCDATSL